MDIIDCNIGFHNLLDVLGSADQYCVYMCKMSKMSHVMECTELSKNMGIKSFVRV